MVCVDVKELDYVLNKVKFFDYSFAITGIDFQLNETLGTVKVLKATSYEGFSDE